MESAERLRVSNKSLEVTSEKLEAELEETKQRLRAALSRPAATGGADGKKSSVVARSAASPRLEKQNSCVHNTPANSCPSVMFLLNCCCLPSKKFNLMSFSWFTSWKGFDSLSRHTLLLFLPVVVLVKCPVMQPLGGGGNSRVVFAISQLIGNTRIQFPCCSHKLLANNLRAFAHFYHALPGLFTISHPAARDQLGNML